MPLYYLHCALCCRTGRLPPGRLPSRGASSRATHVVCSAPGTPPCWGQSQAHGSASHTITPRMLAVIPTSRITWNQGVAEPAGTRAWRTPTRLSSTTPTRRPVMVATSQQSGHDIVPSDRLLFPRTGQKLVVGGQSGVGASVFSSFRLLLKNIWTITAVSSAKQAKNPRRRTGAVHRALLSPFCAPLQCGRRTHALDLSRVVCLPTPWPGGESGGASCAGAVRERRGRQTF